VLKKVLLITDVPFWNKSPGNQCRIWEIVEYLHTISELTIVYAGVANIKSVPNSDSSTALNLFFLNSEEILSARQYGEIFEKFLQGKTFDIWIIEYIHNAYFLTYLPEGVQAILDAHDIISERSKGFRKYNYEESIFELDEETELEILDMFDYVIFLTENDSLFARKRIDEKKILICPHPVNVKKPKLRKKVRNIGFIGSEYIPNVDAVEYFITNCWPLLIKKYPDLTFTIYGNVVKKIQKFLNTQNIVLSGFVESLDMVYSNIDILVNPVRFGSGLKIKNVEALANGLPLITSLHGASGLERIMNMGFLIAENSDEFLNCFSVLIEDFSFRKKISDEAILYAVDNFGHEKCFYELKQLICKGIN